jgi:hypothetical protein
MSATSESHAQLFGSWSSSPSKGKAKRWRKFGDDFYRLTGRWSILQRTFDKAKDWYYEHIVDRETGKVLRHVEEKLSDHVGRGSAKNRSQPPN